MTSSVRNVFVFGADEFNLSQMEMLNRDKKYRFYELFTRDEVKAGPEIPVRQLHKGALEQLSRFPGSIDAVVGYWDFPVSTMLPLLRQPYQLPSPSLEAVLKCEHKYWSRVEQRRVIPQHVPRFCAIDPFAEDYHRQICVGYPFWIKPVKAVSSYLGFQVNDDVELEQAIASIRSNIFRFANPFNYLLQFADLPEEIAGIDGTHCIVEDIISQGRQCTLEGYAHNGDINVYGVVDSVRDGCHRSTFSRYQYPSSLPCHVQRRMVSITERFLKAIDFDDGPFNVEYYWQNGNDDIWLLEVNTRISKSHIPLFRDVDGASHQKVMLETALGEQPRFPYRLGEHRMAAKFMWRIYEDAWVKRVPTGLELKKIQQHIPGVEIELHIEPDMRLSSLKDQDSYSYEIAVIFVGGDNEGEILQKYRTVQEAMRVELEWLKQPRRAAA